MRSLHSHRPTDGHPTEHTVTFDIETIVDEEPADGSFPPWPCHKPVAAAFLRADWDDGRYRFSLKTLICPPGGEVEFFNAVNREPPANITSVSFNGRGFDLPVLQIQAMAAHRFDLAGLFTHTHAQRYQSRHCDLADQFSAYSATRKTSLVELCAALGIPAKTSVHGADVSALWRAGEVDAVQRYIEEDVLATYLLWLHWSAARACDDKLIAVPLADLAAWIESRPDLTHLLPFATCRPALWARPRALALGIERALTDAERRARQAADERAFAGERPIF